MTRLVDYTGITMDTRLCRSWLWYLRLYFITVVIPGCHGEFCELSTHDCSKPGAPCRITGDPGCFMSKDLQRSVDRYPGPVTSFGITTRHVTPDPVTHKSRSNVKVTWGLPANGTHKHLTGFEVRIWTEDWREPYCFIYDLSGASWDFDSMINQYSLNCSSLNADAQYNVQVTSFPRAPFSHKKESAIVYIAEKQGEGRDSWSSDLVIYNQPCNNSLTVMFDMASQEVAMDYYTVSLIDQDSFSPDASDRLPQMDDVRRGIVTMIVPANKQRPMTGRVIKLLPKGSSCQNGQCRSTTSKPFTIGQVDYDLDCTFKQEALITVAGNIQGITKAEVAGIIVGAVLVAAGLTSLLVILARYKAGRRTRKESAGNLSDDTVTISTTGSNRPLVRTNTADSVEKANIDIPKTRKIIYLLYSSDNNHHKNVIGLFADFLSAICDCDVIHDIKYQHMLCNSKMSWINSAMEQCHYILMINSEGSYHRAVASQKNCYYPPNDCDSCLGDMFTPAFQILQSKQSNDPLRQKLILAHFSYTSPQFRLPPLANIQDRKNYQLMTDLEQLYIHIHQLGGTGQRPNCSKYITDLWYDDTQHGAALDQAIGYTKSYINSNPDWFQKIHGQPIALIDHISHVETQGEFKNPWSSSQEQGVHIPRPNPSHHNPQLYPNNNNQFLYNKNMRLDLSRHKNPVGSMNQYSRAFVKPEDTITISSSALGDAIDEINDSGFSSMRPSI